MKKIIFSLFIINFLGISYAGKKHKNVPPVKIITPTFVEVDLVAERIKDNSFFADVINHCNDPSLNFDCFKTNCHESIHSINADLRNFYSNKLQKKMNGFYVGGGKAVIIEEPNVKKSKIAEFIPKKLRFNRYPVYIEGMESMEDTPLYIFDEWVAYTGGSKAAFVDEFWSDSVFGNLEFSVFASALAMTVEKYDPVYWKTNHQFRNFIIWQLEQSYIVFVKAKKLNRFQYDKQDEMLLNLRNAKETELMRNFMQKNLSGIWLENSK